MSSLPGSPLVLLSQFLGLSFCFSFTKNLTLKCLWKEAQTGRNQFSGPALWGYRANKSSPRMCSWPGSPPHGLRRRLGTGLSDWLSWAQEALGVRSLWLGSHTRPAAPAWQETYRPDGRLCPSTSWPPGLQCCSQFLRFSRFKTDD